MIEFENHSDLVEYANMVQENRFPTKNPCKETVLAEIEPNFPTSKTLDDFVEEYKEYVDAASKRIFDFATWMEHSHNATVSSNTSIRVEFDVTVTRE